MTILTVQDLLVGFHTNQGHVVAVNQLNFELKSGEVLGIVGESGSGKSQAMMSLMGLLANNGYCQGQAIFQGQNLLTLPVKALNRIRGNKIAMIFQDPMSSLNPYLRISTQMIEVLQLHRHMRRKAALTTAIAMLETVHISEAAQRIRDYPHQFSGGMRQRVMIAMALLCQPDILIADEPTTALDVTVQAQIMRLLLERQQQHGTTIILITHDLGLVAGICDKVLVMYSGEVMESAPVPSLFSHPLHPYTQGLLKSIPRLDKPSATLQAIAGHPPVLPTVLPGCAFRPRCTSALDKCLHEKPLFRAIPGQVNADHSLACHLDALR